MQETDEDLQPLRNYAFFYLKFRPRSKKEVRDYLLKKIKKRHWSTDSVAKVVSELEEQHFIDDKAFVSWFIEQRNAAKPKSQFVLRGELFRFGIDKSLVDEYFLSHVQPEEELAFKALEPRWRRFNTLSKKERFEKSTSFLLRRGFSFDIAKKIIEKMNEG